MEMGEFSGAENIGRKEGTRKRSRRKSRMTGLHLRRSLTGFGKCIVFPFIIIHTNSYQSKLRRNAYRSPGMRCCRADRDAACISVYWNWTEEVLFMQAMKFGKEHDRRIILISGNLGSATAEMLSRRQKASTTPT